MLVNYPNGLDKQLMEYILNLSQLNRYIFNLRNALDWNAFTKAILETLPPSCAYICGYTTQYGIGHIFLLARTNDNIYVKIDPQVNPSICQISPGSPCLTQLLPPGTIPGVTTYYIMMATEL